MRLQGLMLLMLLCCCQREPTIVVRFERSDLSSGAAASQVDAGHQASEDANNAECKLAADCEAVPVECCDCAHGGRQQAMPKVKAEARRKTLSARCKDVMCTMMLSPDPTCSKRPDCVEGACVMSSVQRGSTPIKSALQTPHSSK